jgi:hypothetical protein
MIELTEDNVILYSYKDVDIEKGVRYLPAIYVECGENEMDNVDLKATIINNTEYAKLYKNIVESEPHGSALDTMAKDIKKLKEQNKELLFDLQEEAMFGMYVVEEKSKLKEKAQAYDDLMNANSEVVQDNITLTETYQKLKKAEEEINILKQIVEVHKR